MAMSSNYLSTNEPTSLSLLHEHWLVNRHERNSSSSSDSGLLYQLSPPGLTPNNSNSLLIIYFFNFNRFIIIFFTVNNTSPSLLSISPPGLSPLQISTDSAFSTPTLSSATHYHNQFTFDPLPYTSSFGASINNNAMPLTSSQVN